MISRRTILITILNIAYVVLRMGNKFEIMIEVIRKKDRENDFFPFIFYKLIQEIKRYNYSI